MLRHVYNNCTRVQMLSDITCRACCYRTIIVCVWQWTVAKYTYTDVRKRSHMHYHRGSVFRLCKYNIRSGCLFAQHADNTAVMHRGLHHHHHQPYWLRPQGWQRCACLFSTNSYGLPMRAHEGRRDTRVFSISDTRGNAFTANCGGSEHCGMDLVFPSLFVGFQHNRVSARCKPANEIIILILCDRCMLNLYIIVIYTFENLALNTWVLPHLLGYRALPLTHRPPSRHTRRCSMAPLHFAPEPARESQANTE